MRTNTSNVAFLDTRKVGKVEIALDDLEFAFPVNQLQEIKSLNHQGYSYKQIAKMVKRDEYEVIIALLHICRKGDEVGPMGGYKK